MIAAALRGGQGSGSAVRLGNDNIEHARPPLGRVVLRRAFLRGRVSPSARRPLALTYLEPGAPGVYHPFASRYFAKLPGIPARCNRKKKNVARPSESLRFTREMAESTECSTCGRGAWEGERNGAPPLSVDAAESGARIRRSRPT